MIASSNRLSRVAFTSSAVGIGIGSSVCPVARWMLDSRCRSRGVTNEIASPLRPARPVRPIRWT